MGENISLTFVNNNSMLFVILLAYSVALQGYNHQPCFQAKAKLFS